MSESDGTGSKGGKKMKQARLPFAPLNKLKADSPNPAEATRKRKLSSAEEVADEVAASEYEPVGADYIQDGLSSATRSKLSSFTKDGDQKENVKRAVKPKKQKTEVEVVTLEDESVQERPASLQGRVKLSFKKNKASKRSKSSGSQEEENSDVDLEPGVSCLDQEPGTRRSKEERAEEVEETSMTEDWAEFHQKELEKNPCAGPTQQIERLVTPKDEKKKPRARKATSPKPDETNLTCPKADERSLNSAAPGPSPKVASNPPRPSPKAETKTASKPPGPSPKADKKKTTTNPLAKFLIKMTPGTTTLTKPKKVEDNDNDIEILEVKQSESETKTKDISLTKSETPDTASADTATPDTASADTATPDNNSKASDSSANSSSAPETKANSSKTCDSLANSSEDPKTPANKPEAPETPARNIKTPAETPASIRAKQLALAKLRVEIQEVNIEMEEAVKLENFLKAHELKQKVTSLEAELDRVQAEEFFVSSKQMPSESSLNNSTGIRMPVLSCSTLLSSPLSRPAAAPTSRARQVSTPGSTEDTPVSMKALTPKQQALQEERRLKAQKEKEEKEKIRLEKLAQKEQEKQDKERQKEIEKRVKEIEKLEKDRQKREKDREKEKERKEKEEERLKKKEEKEAELRKKEEERVKAEEAEVERKRKAAEAFKGFFVKKETAKEVKSGSECSTEKEEIQSISKFNPFQIKNNMRLAPLVRNDTAKATASIDALDSPKGPDSLYLQLLRSGKHTPSKQGKTWPWEKTVDADSDVEIVEEEDEEEEEFPENMDEGVMILQSRVGKNPRAKLLHFHENQRPAYWGTWSKTSNYVSGRRPFGEDKEIMDYEYDSDEDWEDEGEGESLSDADDDKEEEDDYEVDNEFFVPHGYLSDGEEDKDEDEVFNPEREKEKLKMKEKEFQAECKKKTHQLKPRLWGCYWESEQLDTGAAAVQLLKILSGYSAITCCNNNLPIPTAFSKPVNSPTSYIGEDGGDADKQKAKASKVLKSFPEEAVADLVRLVHINSNNKNFLGKEFIQFWNKKTGGLEVGPPGDETPSSPFSQQISHRKIVEKIHEIAEYKKIEGKPGRYWVVRDQVLEKVGLEPTDSNSWTYSLEQTNVKKSSAEDTPGSRPVSPLHAKLSSPNPASLITKFTKVLTEEERARINSAPSSAKRLKLSSPSPVVVKKTPGFNTTVNSIAIKKIPGSNAPVNSIATKRTPGSNTPVNSIATKRTPGSNPINAIAVKKTPGSNSVNSVLVKKTPGTVNAIAVNKTPGSTPVNPIAAKKTPGNTPINVIATKKTPTVAGKKAGSISVRSFAMVGVGAKQNSSAKTVENSPKAALNQLRVLKGLTVTSLSEENIEECITID